MELYPGSELKVPQEMVRLDSLDDCPASGFFLKSLLEPDQSCREWLRLKSQI